MFSDPLCGLGDSHATTRVRSWIGECLCSCKGQQSMTTEDSRQRFWDIFERLHVAPFLNLTDRDSYDVRSEMMTPEELSNLRMVWYRTSVEKDVSYNVVGAVPAVVSEVANDLASWPKRVDNVNYWIGKLEHSDSPGTLLAYRLETGPPLLLDGNHRSVAIATVQSPGTTEVLILEGPIDRKVLPDLRHHCG